jgi:hypothetical protein
LIILNSLFEILLNWLRTHEGADITSLLASNLAVHTLLSSNKLPYNFEVIYAPQFNSSGMVKDPDSVGYVGYVDPNPNSDPGRQKLPVGKRIEKVEILHF